MFYDFISSPLSSTIFSGIAAVFSFICTILLSRLNYKQSLTSKLFDIAYEKKISAYTNFLRLADKTARRSSISEDDKAALDDSVNLAVFLSEVSTQVAIYNYYSLVGDPASSESALQESRKNLIFHLQDELPKLSRYSL